MFLLEWKVYYLLQIKKIVIYCNDITLRNERELDLLMSFDSIQSSKFCWWSNNHYSLVTKEKLFAVCFINYTALLTRPTGHKNQIKMTLRKSSYTQYWLNTWCKQAWLYGYHMVITVIHAWMYHNSMQSSSHKITLNNSASDEQTSVNKIFLKRQTKLYNDQFWIYLSLVQ